MADARLRRAFGGRRPSGALLGVVPFFAYVTVFLVIPTLVVVFGAFVGHDGGLTLANVRALGNPAVTSALWHSVILSAVTAVAGAVIGAVLAYAVSTGRPDGILKRFITSLSGVLAQFGGVALAFAFLATFSAEGYLTKLLTSAGLNSNGGLWLYEWNQGLMLVYLYFQIPLMLIVFLPAVEGLKPQWREAAETLGGSTFVYWRKVAGPILLPSFIGGLLLLFTNAFSAYATAAALVSQGSPLLPLAIGNTLSSEVVLGQENVGKAMALEMVVVVAIVMTAYVLLDRRASRWLVR
ncbi:putative spermidine/putrescine transport system permease protein [Phycicoccus badiiscoriae]|uniref:Putative spermidine/putrescine transport system permease protein n=1 Tax=Pedococcus badiiscoriae TaxID=642776 RepID=A0A852WMY2_9MICO|nr:ABC transporter permease subunit [Pedococcus badiiscoriae]NYG07595.1 putative spermidine/putrescine transport system permease protein [Pedococcus badiiscoriae]